MRCARVRVDCSCLQAMELQWFCVIVSRLGVGSVLWSWEGSWLLFVIGAWFFSALMLDRRLRWDL